MLTSLVAADVGASAPPDAAGEAVAQSAVGASLLGALHAAYPAADGAPYQYAAAAAVTSLGAKEALFHWTHRVAVRTGSDVLLANAWHHRSDSLSSVVALVGIGGGAAGLPYLDPLAGLAVAAMIGHAGVKLAVKSVRQLSDEVDPALTRSVADSVRLPPAPAPAPAPSRRATAPQLAEVPGVSACSLVRARPVGSQCVVDAHLEVADENASLSAAHQVRWRYRVTGAGCVGKAPAGTACSPRPPAIGHPLPATSWQSAPATTCWPNSTRCSTLPFTCGLCQGVRVRARAARRSMCSPPPSAPRFRPHTAPQLSTRLGLQPAMGRRATRTCLPRFPSPSMICSVTNTTLRWAAAALWPQVHRLAHWGAQADVRDMLSQQPGILGVTHMNVHYSSRGVEVEVSVEIQESLRVADVRGACNMVPLPVSGFPPRALRTSRARTHPPPLPFVSGAHHCAPGA